MDEEMYCTTIASSAAGDIRLVRCTRPHGTRFSHYRVQVDRLVDKRHPTLEKAAEHFGRALATDTRHRFNEY